MWKTNSLHFVSIDSIKYTINVATSDKNTEGSYYLKFIATLINYPIIFIEIPFTIKIEPCIIISFVLDKPMLNVLSYTLGNSETVIFTTYTQTPDCGYSLDYSYSIDNELNSIQEWLTFDQTAMNYIINTNNKLIVGSHTISLISSYSALSFIDTTSTIVTFIVPCSLTTWNPNSIPNLATSLDVPYVYFFT